MEASGLFLTGGTANLSSITASCRRRPFFHI